MTGDAAFAEQIKTDYRRAKLDPKTRALADYAARVTRNLSSCSSETIESLRRAGWSDAQIHDATQVIALFNYFTRLADALGVAPEPDMPRPNP